MYTTLLLDLGNTLVAYYHPPVFAPILKKAIQMVADYLQTQDKLTVDDGFISSMVKQENHESTDYAVRPLANRLCNIFQLSKQELSPEFLNALCNKFLSPIFALAKCYDDTIPFLQQARRRGIRTAIVSNTPWGSPSNLWRTELQRHGIADLIDDSIFCYDVGFRKPAKQIFNYTLTELKVQAHQCLFIGDDPIWDIEGPQKSGINTILIDRDNRLDSVKTLKVSDLSEIWMHLDQIT